MDDSPNKGYRLAEVLGDPVRRGVVATLLGLSPPLDLQEMAEHVVEWLRERDVDATTEPDHIRLQLHHVHLPKLASVGILQYDAGTKTIWDYSTAPLATARQSFTEMFEDVETDGADGRPDQGSGQDRAAEVQTPTDGRETTSATDGGGSRESGSGDQHHRPLHHDE